MMPDEELLKILVCPETREPVKQAQSSLIAELNAKIEKGELVHHSGEKVTYAFDGGLLREDERVLYPIREGIPVMLIDERIDL